ncbi:hypothetical protein [Halopiger djelfimassiliensis]|uniref:hypothetical protein n=1 Tax=Halopiger djelfimassiliensis TaxID=1293047 RepID=UPI00067800A1|nr:hypothetical protein [Halopiger djelfimassiliensis]
MRTDETVRRSTVGGGTAVIADLPVSTVFEGSNGRYYTDCQVERNLRVGSWRPCIRQFDPDRRLVEIDGGSLLMLTPIDPDDLPDWIEIRVTGTTARVVDTRRRFPTAERDVTTDSDRSDRTQ